MSQPLQIIVVISFVEEPEYPEKTTNLPLVIDKLYHLRFFYQVHLTTDK
jgi:hypothetical protein